MHRVLIAGIVLSWLAPPSAVAQDFQFMPFAPRAKASLLPPPVGYSGYVAAGDMNHDGLDDLVLSSANLQPSVFFRSPTGWVAPTTLSGPLSKPLLVDLDGDGDRDLVSVPPHGAGGMYLRLYENTPGGLTPLQLPQAMASMLVQYIAVGDLDADGFVDLVISPLALPFLPPWPPLVVARGAPGLQFTLDLTSLPPGLPFRPWPQLMDIDGDGDLDLLASNPTSGLSVLQNNGGSFLDATASQATVRTRFAWAMTADLDGDGHPDCAAVLANGDIDVLWGATGGPTLAAAVATVPGIHGLYPGDFDGDGDVDLMAEHAGGLDVLWNQGNRQITRTTVVAQPTGARGVADMDLDGAADILFATGSEPDYLRCLYRARLEDPAFALGMGPWTGAASPQGIGVAGDIDGDGRTDLVTRGAWQIVVDHALGGGAYRRSTTPSTSGVQPSFGPSELADMDGDGDLDLVAKDSGGVRVVTYDGTGAFTLSLLSPSTVVYGDDLRVADIDGDADLDILMADTRGAVLIRNRGSGQYDPPLVLVPAGSSPLFGGVEVADVDRDGDLDLVTGIRAASGQSHVIARNDGAGAFTPHAAFSAFLGSVPISVRAGDIDGDGDTDLVVADGAPRVLRNNGNGAFADTSFLDVPGGVNFIGSNLVLADLDADGDLDVSALRFADSPSLVVLLNNGTGRFSDASGQRGGAVAGLSAGWLLRAGDIDGDGDVDLIAGTNGEQLVLANHLRQCRSNAAPRLGGVADLHLISGPYFGQPGIGLLGVGFALAAPPLRLPGLAGELQLDPATLQVAAAVATSSIGVSSAFVAMPQDAALFGLEVWFQGAILPSVGQPGFTNAVYEVVLR